MSLFYEKNGKRYFKTEDLRFLRKQLGPSYIFVLQQKMIWDGGDVFWEDVPTVIKDD